MEHLTLDQIIQFVTMDEINDENLKLAAYVNNHIMLCDECRKKVEAYQAVNDALVGGRLSKEPQKKDGPER